MMTDKYIKAIQDQEVTWRDLGYNSFLHRERLQERRSGELSADNINTLIEDGSLDTAKLGSLILGEVIKSLSAEKLTTGTLQATTYIEVGNVGGGKYLRIDGGEGHFLSHDGTNPRGVFGEVT
jgi:hypothetical protein